LIKARERRDFPSVFRIAKIPCWCKFQNGHYGIFIGAYMNYYMISSHCAIKLEYTAFVRFNYSYKINNNIIFMLKFLDSLRSI